MAPKELPAPQNTHAQGGGPCWCGYSSNFADFRKKQTTNQADGMYKKVR